MIVDKVMIAGIRYQALLLLTAKVRRLTPSKSCLAFYQLTLGIPRTRV
jgi:hypothetical protein